MQEAKVSPQGLANFFRREVDDDKKKNNKLKTAKMLFGYLSDHPLSEDRIEMIDSVKVPDATPVLSDEQWHALRMICGELPKPYIQQNPAQP